MSAQNSPISIDQEAQNARISRESNISRVLAQAARAKMNSDNTTINSLLRERASLLEEIHLFDSQTKDSPLLFNITPLSPASGGKRNDPSITLPSIKMDSALIPSAARLVSPSTMKSYGKAFPLWLIFLSGEDFPVEEDPFFCSRHHRYPGVLAHQLALFAVWAKDYTNKHQVIRLLQDLRNSFIQHFAPVGDFNHPMVLKARSDLDTTARDISLKHDERAILAVTPALFFKFWDLYYDSFSTIDPPTIESSTNMMIGLAGGISIAHTLRVSELANSIQKSSKTVPDPDMEEFELLNEILHLKKEDHSLRAMDVKFKFPDGEISSPETNTYLISRNLSPSSVISAVMAYRSSKTIHGTRPRIITIGRRSPIESKVLEACVCFASISEASPDDHFLSRKSEGNYGRLTLTSKMLANAIKTAASLSSPPLNPNNYSTSSFKKAGISWMMSEGIPQSTVNSVSGHSQKGLSSLHYQAPRILPNAFSEIANIKDADFDSNLQNAFLKSKTSSTIPSSFSKSKH